MVNHKVWSQHDNLHTAIDRWVNQRRDMLVSLTAELVQIPSITSPPQGSEKAVQRVIGHWLRQQGLQVSEYEPTTVHELTSHPAWRPGRQYHNRPNVMAYLPGRGGGRSLVFSGHIDTVGLSEEPWQHDPFEGFYDGVNLYGLGAFDMKGGLAAAMMALRCLIDLGIELRGDLYLESVVDEEFGGANGTLASRLRYPDIMGAIVMEPTNLRLAYQHRGIAVWKIVVNGKSGRSYSGESLVNPAKSLMVLLQSINQFVEERNRQRLQKGGGAEPLPWEIDHMHAGPVVEVMGTRVPPAASATFWIELDPDEDPARIEHELQAHLDKRFDPTSYQLMQPVPPLWGSGIPVDHPLTECVRTALTHRENPPITAPFACDGAMFNRVSHTPMVLLGPEGGNAHAANEFVSITSLQELTKTLVRVAISWCGR